jgi:hypothetical protein
VEHDHRYKVEICGVFVECQFIPAGIIERCRSTKLIILHNSENSHSREPKEFLVACREAKEVWSMSGLE